MNTKHYLPWNLKPGMRLAPLTQSWDGKPYAIGRIVTITKASGVFTGAAVWHVSTDLGEKLLYHGSGRGLKAERVAVVVD